jgi:Ca2+-binding RTX toxin-like protein
MFAQQLTATDAMGRVTILATRKVTISVVALEADALHAGNFVLTVGGSLAGNTIQIDPGTHGGFAVTIDGIKNIYSAPDDNQNDENGNHNNQNGYHNNQNGNHNNQNGSGIDRIEVFTQAGTNKVTISNKIKLTTELFGGRGIDNLSGGGGSTILVGGSGTETLTGGQGRNLIIGGDGKATLLGGAQDDILVGGATAYDMNEAALLAVLKEWNSGDTYARRIADINDTQPRATDSYFLDSATVYDALAHDILTGNAGRDWFFAGAGDVVTDQAANETKS